MKLTTREDSTNYAVSVIKLPPKQPVPGLDRLVRVTVFGNDVLTQKDTDEDQLYLFFPAECQINDAYLRANNEFRHENLNADPTKKGFFEDSGRVKAIKFKGVISTGYLAPITSLAGFTSAWDGLKPGDEFTTIDGKELVRKYRPTRTPGTTGANESRYNKKLKRFDKLVPNQFRFHVDTAQLAKNLHVVNPTDIIVITDKWHGTSAVFANVLVNKQLSWKDRAAKFFGVNVETKIYDNLYSSRSVLKNQYINKEQGGGYYGEDLWGTWSKALHESAKIEYGITLYGEIVGQTASGKAIQKGYAYGCSQGQNRLLIYRITYTTPHGYTIEYSWQQIKDYCAKHGLEHVREIYFGRVDHGYEEIPADDAWREKFLELLQSYFLEKDCPFNPGMPAEGICLRIDGKPSYMTYKLKSKRFFEHETKELDTGIVSMEDEQIEDVEVGVAIPA